MSFYIRKSIKVGPVRFNLSKSGIGVSGGVKGLRLGSGPRGNYIHMGLGGIYYRKTISSPSQSPSPTTEFQASPLPASPISNVAMSEIESADVANMAHSSSIELLQELNEKKKIARIGPWFLWGAILLMGLMLSGSLHPIIIFILGGGMVAGIYLAFRRDEILKTTVLIYDFDSTFEQAFGALHASANQLASCSGHWHKSASGKVHDKKYHAGASELVDREKTTIKSASPKFLKTNIQTVAIGAGRQILYFFPDRLLVFDDGRIGAIGYDELRISVSQSRFIEDSAPKDARIVDYTWRYVNKKGGPDKRFANNPQLPICLYDQLHFSSKSGLNEIILVSRCGVGQSMEKAIQNLAQHTTRGEKN